MSPNSLRLEHANSSFLKPPSLLLRGMLLVIASSRDASGEFEYTDEHMYYRQQVSFIELYMYLCTTSPCSGMNGCLWLQTNLRWHHASHLRMSRAPCLSHSQDNHNYSITTDTIATVVKRTSSVRNSCPDCHDYSPIEKLKSHRSCLELTPNFSIS